jgi:hypothetical protein
VRQRDCRPSGARWRETEVSISAGNWMFFADVTRAGALFVVLLQIEPLTAFSMRDCVL